MGKIVVHERMIGSQYFGSNNQLQIPLKGRVISIAIQNMDVSADRLLIGWNENATTKNYLNPSESKPYGPNRSDDEYQEKQVIYLAFENSNSSNRGLVTIQMDVEDKSNPC